MALCKHYGVWGQYELDGKQNDIEFWGLQRLWCQDFLSFDVLVSATNVV